MINKANKETMQSHQDANRPIVSICCIAFNQERYIAKALDSFLMQQTDFVYEILIHDDASTDKTAEIIRSYEVKYPSKIKGMYQKENQYSKGVRINPTFNFPRAKGKYIAMCEGDDYWRDSKKLQKQVDFLEKNEEYVCCFHDSVVIDSEDNIIGDSLLGRTQDYSAEDMLSTQAFITTHTALFRNIIDFPEELQKSPFGDMVIWHLLGFHGKAKYLDRIEKAAYRRHQEGVWSSLDSFTKYQKTVFARKLIKKHLLACGKETMQIEKNIRNDRLKYLGEAMRHGDILHFFKSINHVCQEHEKKHTCECTFLVLQAMLQRIRGEIKKWFIPFKNK